MASRFHFHYASRGCFLLASPSKGGLKSTGSAAEGGGVCLGGPRVSSALLCFSRFSHVSFGSLRASCDLLLSRMRLAGIGSRASVGFCMLTPMHNDGIGRVEGGSLCYPIGKARTVAAGRGREISGKVQLTIRRNTISKQLFPRHPSSTPDRSPNLFPLHPITGNPREPSLALPLPPSTTTSPPPMLPVSSRLPITPSSTRRTSTSSPMDTFGSAIRSRRAVGVWAGWDTAWTTRMSDG